MKIKEVFLMCFVLMAIVAYAPSVFAQTATPTSTPTKTPTQNPYGVKIHKDGPDTMAIDNGGKLDMRGGAIAHNGAVATPMPTLAVPTPNPTPVGTIMWGEINKLQNATNALQQAMKDVGMFATLTPTPTPTPTLTPTP